MFSLVIAITLNLSHPRKILMSQLDEIILQAKLRGYHREKLSLMLPLTLYLAFNSQTVSAKTLEIKDTKTLDFLYSLVIPFIEVIKSKKDLLFFIKYVSGILRNDKDSQ